MRLMMKLLISGILMAWGAAPAAVYAVDCYTIQLARGGSLGPVALHDSDDERFICYQRAGETMIFRINKSHVKATGKADCAPPAAGSPAPREEESCFNIVLRRGDVFRRVLLLPTEDSQDVFYKRHGDATTFRVKKSMVRHIEWVECPKSWDSASERASENRCFNLGLANGQTISGVHYKREELFGQAYIVYWREGETVMNRLSASVVVNIEEVACKPAK